MVTTNEPWFCYRYYGLTAVCVVKLWWSVCRTQIVLCTVVVVIYSEHVVLTWGLVWLWKLGHRVLKAGEFGLHYPKSFCKPDLLSFEELLHLPQYGHHSVLIHTTLKNKPRTSSSATNRAPGYNLMASSYRLMIDSITPFKEHNLTEETFDIINHCEETLPQNIVWKWKNGPDEWSKPDVGDVMR